MFSKLFAPRGVRFRDQHNRPPRHLTEIPADKYALITSPPNGASASRFSDKDHRQGPARVSDRPDRPRTMIHIPLPRPIPGTKESATVSHPLVPLHLRTPAPFRKPRNSVFNVRRSTAIPALTRRGIARLMEISNRISLSARGSQCLHLTPATTVPRRSGSRTSSSATAVPGLRSPRCAACRWKSLAAKRSHCSASPGRENPRCSI